MLILVSFWLVSVGLVSAASAEEPSDVPVGQGAPEDPPPDPPPDEDHTFERVLETAKGEYFSGEADRAKTLLQGLQLRLYSGEEPPWDVVVDAMIYLGEIYYFEGEVEEAKAVFRFVLEQDLEAPISPYSHSLEVVNQFELVRADVLADRRAAPPPPERTPLPAWAFLPLGVPQFGQRRVGAGFVYGGLQVGLASASIGMRLRLARLNPLEGAQLAPTEQLLTEKFLYQWPSTFGFYLMWGVSTLDASRYHSRPFRRVGVGTSPGGTPTVEIGGQL